MSGEDCPKREPQVQSELNRLDKAIAVNNETIQELETRLAIVCRVEPEQIFNDKSLCTGALVSLAENIKLARERLDKSTAKARSIITTLEV
jgi:hypothetical protein